MPQYVLGRTAERVFSIEDCFDDKEGFCTDVRTKSSNTDAVMQPNLMSYLREKFSPKITPEVVNSISGNKDLNKATLSQCWRNGNMPSETISNFLKAYDVDFEKYGYSKELPGGKQKSAVFTSSSSSPGGCPTFIFAQSVLLKSSQTKQYFMDDTKCERRRTGP